MQNLSYLSWYGTGDEKGNTTAPSDKLVTGKRNRNIDPREQGKFLFWRGVNNCYGSEDVVKKKNSPLLVEERKRFKQDGNEAAMMEEKCNHVWTQMDVTVTV